MRTRFLCRMLLLLLLSNPILWQWVVVADPGIWMGFELLMGVMELMLLLLWYFLCSKSL